MLNAAKVAKLIALIACCACSRISYCKSTDDVPLRNGRNFVNVRVCGPVRKFASQLLKWINQLRFLFYINYLE